MANATDFQAWIEQWAACWHAPGLPAKVAITFSPRLQSALGRCLPSQGVVRLHPGLLDAPQDALKEVLCHESAHIAVWLLHGKKARPHGREWKELMRRAGYEPRVKWPREALPAGIASTPILRYLHACPVCGARRAARRVVRAWRCRACLDAGLDGRLVVSTVPLP